MSNEPIQRPRRRPPDITAPGTSSDLETRVDGRLERRRRNRRAVLDAYLDLTRQGAADPTMEQLAEVAGVSHRSVFRYFDDRSALVLAAADRVMERLEPVIFTDIDPTDPARHRVERFVAARVAGWNMLGPTAARVFARGEELSPGGLDATRRRLRDDLAAHVSPELALFDPGERATRLDLADLPFQFEPMGLLSERSRTDGALASHLRLHLVSILQIG